MAEKAIIVTNANIAELNSRFQHDGTGVPAAVGYILVCGFGADEDYSMMNKVRFFQKYEKGADLRNGFFEAIPIVESAAN